MTTIETTTEAPPGAAHLYMVRYLDAAEYESDTVGILNPRRWQYVISATDIDALCAYLIGADRVYWASQWRVDPERITVQLARWLPLAVTSGGETAGSERVVFTTTTRAPGWQASQLDDEREALRRTLSTAQRAAQLAEWYGSAVVTDGVADTCAALGHTPTYSPTEAPAERGDLLAVRRHWLARHDFCWPCPLCSACHHPDHCNVCPADEVAGF